jgi:ubiquinone/menaquinone biosynthesis C-methylase UbiE
MAGYIHGSSDKREVARLELQARYMAPKSLPSFIAKPGDWVLDLGTGVGAMAQRLLERFPGIHVVGADLRQSQLVHARANHPGARYVQADATSLPFPDACFDRVHSSWLLEHVPGPERAVREVLRVLKPGGTCQFLEVNNDTLVLRPENADLSALLAQVDQLQLATGGDPHIGVRMKGLFKSAGFSHVEDEPFPLGADAKDPLELAEYAEDVARLVESADEALGPTWAARLQAGIEQLRTLAQKPDGVLRHTATLLRATK